MGHNAVLLSHSVLTPTNLFPTSELDETNLAEFGSQLEKDHRKQEGALEQAWGKSTGVGSQTGLWVWRIENFQVVAVPKADQGKFYTGDSYIVLNV